MTPLEYKRLLISNVLILRITYVLALFGGHDSNVNSIKKVINRAISTAIEKVNFSIARIYEEFGLMQMEAMAKYFQAKSLLTWAKTLTPMTDLITSGRKCNLNKKLG
ncbi:hypothetical protein NUSPORA_01415 [Nucleospora cyclopteri]